MHEYALHTSTTHGHEYASTVHGPDKDNAYTRARWRELGRLPKRGRKDVRKKMAIPKPPLTCKNVQHAVQFVAGLTCHKYILYLYLYLYIFQQMRTPGPTRMWAPVANAKVRQCAPPAYSHATREYTLVLSGSSLGRRS